MPEYFDFERDWDEEISLAILAWRLVVLRLAEGVFILDLIREVEENLDDREVQGLYHNFYYAIWFQLMEFLADLLLDLEIFILDLIAEAEASLAGGEPQVLHRNFYYAIWRQLMDFLADLLVELERGEE
ncbi:hypothetical protein G7046_g4357 [Stylonectria norvegica]|nr:hypothetical protein G7046_g4357 [Stylonectria norvegica]